MKWMEHRETTRSEDKAYSLLGIFDVMMPLLYGEGEQKAFRRLREEINKAARGGLPSTVQAMTDRDAKCLEDLRITDPRDDKIRIEQTKGGLLKDSYRWILDNADFRRWRDDHGDQSRHGPARRARPRDGGRRDPSRNRGGARGVPALAGDGRQGARGDRPARL